MDSAQEIERVKAHAAVLIQIEGQGLDLAQELEQDLVQAMAADSVLELDSAQEPERVKERDLEQVQN